MRLDKAQRKLLLHLLSAIVGAPDVAEGRRSGGWSLAGGEILDKLRLGGGAGLAPHHPKPVPKQQQCSRWQRTHR